MTRARRLELVAVVALGFAFVWPMQGGGSLQNAHYALLQALASGTPAIDDVIGNVGTGTNDLTTFEGHTYSNKAPGTAAILLPAYLVLRAAGVETDGDPVRMQWALGLLASALPALGLVLLVRRTADRLEPGFGMAAAVTLGAATLILPFATLLLSHVLSAFLAFAAFALLVEERRGPPRPLLTGAAGLLAGIAVTVEYPNAIAVAVLGLYLLARGPRLARAVAYGAAAVAAMLPVLLYNIWAFGSATHSSYEVGPGNDSRDFFGAPAPGVALQLFVSKQGLLVTGPVLAAALAGIVLLLRRRGARAEALAIGGIVLGFTVLSAAWYSPFGGFGPGPRFLIVALPFLAAALGPVFRAAPVTTGALAVVSGVVMVLLTATHPLAGYDGAWVDRLRDGDVPLTAASLAGITGWYAVLPLFAAVAVAGWCALRASPRVALRPADTAFAGAAVLLWALVAATARDGGPGSTPGRVFLASAAVAGALLLAGARRPSDPSAAGGRSSLR